MICRNCSAVISDDCEICPSCEKKPDKRGQNVNTAAVIILISILLFLSCTAIALKINKAPIAETTASTETTAFFVLEEKTETEAQTETEESTKEETAESEENTSDTVQSVQTVNYDVETFDVTDSSGKMRSERAVIIADKEDFQKNGKQNIDSVCKSVVTGSDYSWLTVDFGDSTGIVFLSNSTSAASYGIIDDRGLISELFGVIIIGGDTGYSYFPVSRTESSESETANTEETEEATQETDVQITESITTEKETAKTETETETQTQVYTSEESSAVVTAAENDNSGSIVYITATGKKYHRAGCASLSKSKIEIDRSEAISKGYEPCKRCNP
ncbi:MAG: hypothetical protein ACI4SB_08755 [Acutalibacteraceae bacterium]